MSTVWRGVFVPGKALWLRSADAGIAYFTTAVKPEEFIALRVDAGGRSRRFYAEIPALRG